MGLVPIRTSLILCFERYFSTRFSNAFNILLWFFTGAAIATLKKIISLLSLNVNNSFGITFLDLLNRFSSIPLYSTLIFSALIPVFSISDFALLQVVIIVFARFHA